MFDKMIAEGQGEELNAMLEVAGANGTDGAATSCAKADRDRNVALNSEPRSGPFYDFSSSGRFVGHTSPTRFCTKMCNVGVGFQSTAIWKSVQTVDGFV
jgi:hypothetical protein